MTRHDMEIELDSMDGTYMASCSCGWEGDERNAEADAISDGETHCREESS